MVVRRPASFQFDDGGRVRAKQPLLTNCCRPPCRRAAVVRIVGRSRRCSFPADAMVDCHGAAPTRHWVGRRVHAIVNSLIRGGGTGGCSLLSVLGILSRIQ